MIAIIDGCGTNIASVQFALERLGQASVLTTDPEVIKAASHVILPGVGAAKHAMNRLQELQLTDVIKQLKQPVLGICLGMQLLFESSSEGSTECLGIIPGKIDTLPYNPLITIPHMGWNQLQILQTESPLLKGVENNSYVYFIHSYVAAISDFTVAATEHGIYFSAIVQRENFYATQFHPERSGQTGEKILRNFLEI